MSDLGWIFLVLLCVGCLIWTLRACTGHGRKPKPIHPAGVELYSDNEQFTLTRVPPDPPLVMRWHDVAEIVAYKQDFWAYDRIYIVFLRRGNDDEVEIDEEMPGYKRLMEVVESRYPLPENWWHDIAFPAFEANTATILKAES